MSGEVESGEGVPMTPEQKKARMIELLEGILERLDRVMERIASQATCPSPVSKAPEASP